LSKWSIPFDVKTGMVRF